MPCFATRCSANMLQFSALFQPSFVLWAPRVLDDPLFCFGHGMRPLPAGSKARDIEVEDQLDLLTVAHRVCPQNSRYRYRDLSRSPSTHFWPDQRLALYELCSAQRAGECPLVSLRTSWYQKVACVETVRGSFSRETKAHQNQEDRAHGVALVKRRCIQPQENNCTTGACLAQ